MISFILPKVDEKVFNEGYQAYMDSKDSLENPYNPDHNYRLSYSWFIGWDTARIQNSDEGLDTEF